MKKLFSVTTFVVLCISVYAQFTWVNMDPFAGSARSRSASFVLDGYGYIVSGKTSATPVIYTQSSYRYDPVTDGWSAIGDFPLALSGTTSFVIDDFAYVVGGGNTSNVIFANCYQYNATNDTFVAKAPYPNNNGIVDAFGFALNGKGYVGSGTYAGASQPTKDLYEYNPLNNSWTSKAQIPGSARICATAFTIGNYAYVGLGTNGASAHYSDFYRYDPTNNNWIAIAAFPGKERLLASAFVINDIAYVGGGFRSINGNFFALSDFYAYAPQANTWTAVPGLPGYPRGGAEGFAINNSGYVVNGYEWDGPYYNKVSRFGTCDVFSGGMGSGGNGVNQFRLYPNPTQSQINVSTGLPVNTLLQYEVLSLEGRLIKSGSSTQESFSISCGDMANGIYILNLKDRNTKYATKKFVVSQ